MALSIELVSDARRLAELAPEWMELARGSGDGGMFRGPTWILPWFKHFIPALEATLHVVVGWDGSRCVSVAPLYSRSVRLGAGVKVREIRLAGDAGPRPPALDLVVAPGYEERFAIALAQHFTGEGAPPWDVIDLAPLRDPSRSRAFLAEKLDAGGRKVDCQDAGMTMVISLATAGLSTDSLPPTDESSHVVESASYEKGLVALRRLSRLEWADRDEASPFAAPEASFLLLDILSTLGPLGRARLARLDDDTGEASAAAVIVDDAPRAVCVGLAVDPELARGPNSSLPAPAVRLISAEARAAASRGLRALDVVVGASDFDPPALPVSQRRSLRLRAFNANAAGTLARTYSSLRRRAEAAREAPGAAAAGARAAWAKIREAASTVASYERLHLYRGQLWTRGIPHPDDLTVEELDEAGLDQMSAVDRQGVLDRLELDETYCREKWRRGDLVVMARLARRPSGIAWCARSAVLVVEIGREVRPGTAECYIHDVFVAPDARGKNVAPAMLEDLAKRLRERDVYRAWALIEPSNVASTRAFEKAAYAAVADVIYARMAVVDKIVIRPPDPEAKRLLGLS